jgi:hypothetical protein
MIYLEETYKYHPRLRADAENHYSNPKGFVGRSICYFIKNNDIVYGSYSSWFCH